MEWTQEWKKEGLEEGLQKGRQEGGAEALQDLLLLQMEGRFGSVPKALRRQIKSIQDSEKLKRIGQRLLAASSLDDLGL